MSKVPGWRVLCMAAVMLPAALAVHASTPVIWKLAGHGDFIRGETRGVSITGKGRLTLSPVLDLVFESDEPLIWSLAADSRGNLYAGTGNDGKLYRIDPSGRSEVFFDAEELEIRSVVIDRHDRVYAATFPDGRIHRIDPDGTHAVFFDPARDGGMNGPAGEPGSDPDGGTGNGPSGGTNYIWSLALSAGGGLYAGTGGQGRIYRIDENGGAHLLAELEEAHVMALAVDGSGRLIAGTEPGGRVYRVTSDGAISVLHDSPYGEVNTLLVGEDGAIFAGALSGPRRGARGGRAGTAGASMPPPSTGAPDDPGGAPMLNAVQVTASAEPADRPSVGGFATGGSVVFRIEPDGRVEEWWRSQTDVGLSLAIRGENELLIGTGSSGRLYSVRERGVGTLLNELQESQITALSPDASDGVVVATSNRGNLYRLRSTPVREGEYESDVRDTRGMARWGRIRWESEQPSGTSVRLFARSGNTDSPDQTWSEWTGPYTDPAGEALACPPARYLQWKAVLGTENEEAPTVSSVSASYLTRNNPPRVHAVTVYEPGVYLRDAAPGQVGQSAQTDLPPGIAAQVGGRGNGRGQNASSGSPTYRKGMRAVAVRASDPDGDGLSYEIYFRGVAEEMWKRLESERRTPSYSWDSETFPDGEYVLRVVASDAPSNPPDQALEAEYLSEPFLVDNTGPQVTRIDVEGGLLSFMVRDGASPLYRVEYAIDGGDWRVVHPEDGVTDSETEAFEIALDGLESGEHTLAIRARDTANNTGTGKRVVTIP